MHWPARNVTLALPPIETLAGRQRVGVPEVGDSGIDGLVRHPCGIRALRRENARQHVAGAEPGSQAEHRRRSHVAHLTGPPPAAAVPAA